MPPPYTHKPRRRSKWAAYNRRRAANLEADRRRRLETRALRVAQAESAIIAQHEHLLANPIAVPPAPPPVKIRIRLEVVGHGSHQLTTTWDPYARQWRPSKRRLLEGISALLARTPVLAEAA